MKHAIHALLLVILLVGGVQTWAPPAGTPITAMSEPMLTTSEGSVLRVGPAEVTHFAGLLANGEGAFGVAVAPDGAYLAFTCGMRPHAGVWYSGDWYRGKLAKRETTTMARPDGEELVIERASDGALVGSLRSSTGNQLAVEVVMASLQDGLFRRDDADGVLGAVALPGNTVCAVKRTADDRFLPAGTVPY
ncbi:MAG TPA: hypothetical protein VGR08_07745 [Thermomicrobiales bacterium]|nr:hypothetical protein [Thermomicrobiales bacterium]